MKKLLLALALALVAVAAQAQTNTPTETPTATPTNTPTATPTAGPAAPSKSAANSYVMTAGGDISAGMRLDIAGAYIVTIASPGTLDGTLTIQVSSVDPPTWNTMDGVPGTPLVGPLANKTAQYSIAGVAQLRIKQSTNAVASRTFVITAAKLND